MTPRIELMKEVRVAFAFAAEKSRLASHLRQSDANYNTICEAEKASRIACEKLYRLMEELGEV